jgi:hypothetical protein
VTCSDLAGFGSPAAVLAAAPTRAISPILPRLVLDGGEPLLETELP